MTETRTEAQARAKVDLDHHSPEFREDPYGKFREMRESGCPVAHSDHYEGFWALVDYASVFEAARDDDLFNSFPSVGVPASELPLPILPIESDLKRPGFPGGSGYWIPIKGWSVRYAS
ncbi:hypothetical protein MAHJHV50_48500 [Mycobacterium avium subsp. hominissuis]